MKESPFTPAQVKLARRICAEESKDYFTPKPPIPFKEAWDNMMNAPIHPTGGPTPPWWQQAVRWADNGDIWVGNFGYTDVNLWNDISSYPCQ